MVEIAIDAEFFDGEPETVTFVEPDGSTVEFERTAADGGEVIES